MRVSLIAALASNRVIGVENRLPWSLPGDLKRFRQLTTGHPVIMGRKTFESIGRALPNRLNIVISRTPGYQAQGALVAGSLEAALEVASHGPGSEEVFVIGGGEIYRLALPHAQRLYLTWVHQEVAGDATFPQWKENDFRELSREDVFEPIPHSFVVLERIPAHQTA